MNPVLESHHNRSAPPKKLELNAGRRSQVHLHRCRGMHGQPIDRPNAVPLPDASVECARPLTHGYHVSSRASLGFQHHTADHDGLHRPISQRHGDLDPKALSQQFEPYSFTTRQRIKLLVKRLCAPYFMLPQTQNGVADAHASTVSGTARHDRRNRDPFRTVHSAKPHERSADPSTCPKRFEVVVEDLNGYCESNRLPLRMRPRQDPHHLPPLIKNGSATIPRVQRKRKL